MIIVKDLIKITQQSLLIIFAIVLGLKSFLDYPALAQTQIIILLNQTPPKEPHTPGPTSSLPAGGQNYSPVPPSEGDIIFNAPPFPPIDNETIRVRPGGLFTPSCKSTTRSLTALIPIKNPALTTREHPTFLFYVPDASDEIRVGEFSLLVGPQEKTRLYKTRFTLPQTPGIVSITLPSAPEYALEEGQYYRWYFKLYCQSNTSSQPDVDVNGWVQRVALTPERERQIKAAAPDVWYDASANLAESLRALPQDVRLRNDWLNLLKSIGLEDLAQEPLVGPVIPLERNTSF
jgi:hypothetical protein